MGEGQRRRMGRGCSLISLFSPGFKLVYAPRAKYSLAAKDPCPRSAPSIATGHYQGFEGAGVQFYCSLQDGKVPHPNQHKDCMYILKAPVHLKSWPFKLFECWEGISVWARGPFPI